ncbi:MAG: hypothetical protein WC773_00375 [Patescibacteria group bacterium]
MIVIIVVGTVSRITWITRVPNYYEGSVQVRLLYAKTTIVSAPTNAMIQTTEDGAVLSYIPNKDCVIPVEFRADSQTDKVECIAVWNTGVKNIVIERSVERRVMPGANGKFYIRMGEQQLVKQVNGFQFDIEDGPGVSVQVTLDRGRLNDVEVTPELLWSSVDNSGKSATLAVQEDRGGEVVIPLTFQTGALSVVRVDADFANKADDPVRAGKKVGKILKVKPHSVATCRLRIRPDSLQIE